MLVEQCLDCHGEKKAKGGLRLDSREALRKGGDSGAAFVPGKPEESLLITAVRYADKDLQMPPPKDHAPRKLGAEAIADLAAWVKMGAPDPRDAPPPSPESKPAIDYAAARRQWAYHRPEKPMIPAVRDAAWPQSPIDNFILAQLETRGLHPAPPADPRTLIRRMTFDLIGLPPTPEETETFVRESIANRQSAIANALDRLLASPRYGERWARHWLDVVRYTDSFDARGLSGDGKMDCREAWRYRDWVVDALNRDLPYDQFIQHQVAGDILSAQAFDAEKIVATGVYALGNWGGGDADKEKLLTDIADDQVDLTGRAFLGLTVACARCHDHKFDPIATEDYYGLAGIFFSSHILPDVGPKTNGPDMLRVSLLAPAEQAKRDAARKRLGALDAELARSLTPLTEVKRDVAGKPGLIGWSPRGADNPSVVINSTDADIAFSTIKLPARAIAVHPGPKTPVTAAWRSPRAGKVRVSARLRDVDPNCGDGIAWRLRQGAATLAEGTMENGGAAEFPEREIAVEAAQLLTLTVSPRAEYTCDSTQLDFVIRAEDGTVWDLREALVGGAAQGRDLWWVCAGEGDHLPGDAGAPRESTALEAERKQLAAILAEPAPLALAMQEGGCPESPQAGLHDVRVHVRGRYDRLGALVPRHFPTLLAGDTAPVFGANESGRLALARWLASPKNPLTARVIVNRAWQHHFGEGIVRTPNNFGKLGTPPTHPELLDWLACEFMEQGWSLKELHRAILLSAAWQQSGAADAEMLRADPGNELLGRANRRRLESEPLRDALLAVAGTLDLSPGGTAFRDFTTPRRTLYLMTVRSDRTGYQSLFDAADPTAIVERRVDSTVAPQALFLLNHPFALAQATALAQRMERQAAGDGAARIAWLYQRLYARPPTADETRLGLAAVEQSHATWEQYCHALLCANEFLFVD